MRNICIAAVLLLALGVFAALYADPDFPRMHRVEPAIAQSGDSVTVSGENLDRANVAELYLTDGKRDVKVPIIEQTASHVIFRVPTDAGIGRFGLMVLTTGAAPKLIEQPVKVTLQ